MAPHTSSHFFTYLTALDGTVLKNNLNQIKENNLHIHVHVHVTLTQCVSQRACTASQTERTNITKHLIALPADTINYMSQSVKTRKLCTKNVIVACMCNKKNVMLCRSILNRKLSAELVSCMASISGCFFYLEYR